MPSPSMRVTLSRTAAACLPLERQAVNSCASTPTAMAFATSDPASFTGTQAVVHLPELALITGAGRGLVRPERVGMKLSDRIVDERVGSLAGLDVFVHDLRERLLRAAAAERAVVIGHLNDRHLRAG